MLRCYYRKLSYDIRYTYLNMPQRLLNFRGISHYQIDGKIVDLVDDGVVPKYALQKLKEITDKVVVLHVSLQCYSEPAAEEKERDPEMYKIMQKHKSTGKEKYQN